MKSIKDLREQYDLITEKEEAETKKLAALVRAGLFDAKKLTSLKRALDKPVDKMTAQEKRMLLNLLDALMSEVLSNQPVYQKVKQNVMKESVVVDTKDYLTKMDPRVKRYGYSQKDAPSVLLLKRKAIRVFPDGQKVALYYAQAIDKYVSIPFSEIGINETWLGDIVRGIVRSVSGGNDSNSSAKKDEDEIAKELKPLEREKTKLNVSSDLKDKPYITGVEARRQKYERDANMAMAKGVKESFKAKLKTLNEFKEAVPGQENKFKKSLEVKPSTRQDLKGSTNKKYIPKKVEVKPGKVPNRLQQYRDDAAKRLARQAAEKTAEKTAVSATKAAPSFISKAAPYAIDALKIGGKLLGAAGLVLDPIVSAKPAGEGSDKPSGPLMKGNTLKTKVATPPDRPIGSLPKAKADSKGTSAFSDKGIGKKTVNPYSKPAEFKGVTDIPDDRDRAEPENTKKLRGDSLKDVKSGVTTATDTKPSTSSGDRISPTQEPSSQPRATEKAQGQPWQGADKWKEPAKSEKKKSDEEGTGKREPKDTKSPKPPRKPFKLPALAADAGAKALTAMTPGLKLAISGPKREGDADAIRSRLASYERRAWQAQAAGVRESVEIDLNGNRFVLNNEEANKVISLYESLNTKNKQKMIKMMNESEEQLNKIVSFAVRQ